MLFISSLHPWTKGHRPPPDCAFTEQIPTAIDIHGRYMTSGTASLLPCLKLVPNSDTHWKFHVQRNIPSKTPKAHEWSKSYRGPTSEQCSRPSAVPENTLLLMDDFPVCGWWSNDNPQRLSLSIVLPVIIHQGFWTDHTQLSPVSDETILDQVI